MQVGADEVGNKYYRKLEKNLDGEVVEKRFFKPPERGVYEPDSLAPEWSQWLRRTRVEVPTDEDVARQVQGAITHPWSPKSSSPVLHGQQG